jgi:hypothetical protein
MFFVKSNNEPIIGITGELHFGPHEIHSSKWNPKVQWLISITKPSYYYLGFGAKIKQGWEYKKRIGFPTAVSRTKWMFHSPIMCFHFERIHENNDYVKGWKKTTYMISFFIENQKLFDWLLK